MVRVDINAAVGQSAQTESALARQVSPTVTAPVGTSRAIPAIAARADISARSAEPARMACAAAHRASRRAAMFAPTPAMTLAIAAHAGCLAEATIAVLPCAVASAQMESQIGPPSAETPILHAGASRRSATAGKVRVYFANGDPDCADKSLIA